MVNKDEYIIRAAIVVVMWTWWALRYNKRESRTYYYAATEIWRTKFEL